MSRGRLDMFEIQKAFRSSKQRRCVQGARECFCEYVRNGWPQYCLKCSRWRIVSREDCTKTLVSRPSIGYLGCSKSFNKKWKSRLFLTFKIKRLITNVSVVDPGWPTLLPGLLCHLSKSKEGLGTKLVSYLVFPHPSCLGHRVSVSELGCAPFLKVLKLWRQNVWP